MKRDLVIESGPIDEPALVAKREASSGMGAVVCFSGVVRATESGVPIDGIEYEAFLEMAKFQFNKLFDEIEIRWPVESIRVVHRIGWVKWGEPSLWVEIIAPHRGEALVACGWLIDRMKEVVPIWKRPRNSSNASHTPP
jgi:molybdopterin synthase catalytic subunit